MPCGEGGKEGDGSRSVHLGKADKENETGMSAIEDGYTFRRLEHSGLYLPVMHEQPKVLEPLKTSTGDQTCEPGSISDYGYKNRYYI